MQPRALRCRACGSDWEAGRCLYCGHDEFVDVLRFYPWMWPMAAP